MKFFFIKINLHKKKGYSNALHRNNILRRLGIISRTLGIYSSKYENIIYLENLDASTNEKAMHLLHLAWFNKSRKATYSLEKVLDATFHRSYKTPCSICSLCVLESGLSDFHGRAASVMKIPFRKLPPNIIADSDFKKFPSAMS